MRTAFDLSLSPDATASGARADTTGLAARYQLVRQTTERLCAPLSPEDCIGQSMPDCSPVKWHVAHTTWFFETFVLEQAVPGYAPFNPAYRVLFNSYYKTVGEQYARPQRGLLTRPALDEVMHYRQHVDAVMLKLLGSRDSFDTSLPAVIELGLHHEQQHQELILTDFKHLLSFNPLHPVYRDRAKPLTITPQPLCWHRYGEGVNWIGHAGDGFSFDNEQPRHRVFIESFELASRLVTNHEYLDFIADGGYKRPEFWLSDGWNAVQNFGWRAPLYWQQRDGARFVHTLSGLRELNPSEPVCHVSYYEAEAYARWAQARLATEMEWEVAAEGVKLEGNFIENELFHPSVATAAAGSVAPQQLFGDVWEWTQSPYSSYPGFQPPEGALGEYNGKFMCNQMVLRGGSCATPQAHLRASYRNFFPPDARWQFSGIRLARDVRS